MSASVCPYLATIPGEVDLQLLVAAWNARVIKLYILDVKATPHNVTLKHLGRGRLLSLILFHKHPERGGKQENPLLPSNQVHCHCSLATAVAWQPTRSIMLVIWPPCL